MVVWSLFDGSGIMALPWAHAGHEVYCFNSDDADHGQYVVKMEHERIHYVNCWIEPGFDFHVAPGIIFAFPSCTELAGCGEKHERSSDDISVSVDAAKIAESLAEKYNCPWMVENPVGKLSTQWRKPNFYFDPYEYGGYMSGFEPAFHPKMPAFDGYTKKTCIWAGGGFVMPKKKPGPINIGLFWGWRWLGGNSARTKQLRSLTPRGFARAVYEANHG